MVGFKNPNDRLPNDLPSIH